MYIGKLGDGSSKDDGIYVLLKETIDNSIDEYVMGYGKHIEVNIKDGKVEVRDYGRGIPLGKVIECVSKINTGAKYDSKAFKKSVGLNGVGTKAVNALSSYFKIESVRDGQVKRDEALAHARAIVEATQLPVSADFENGFADEPGKAAETVRLAAEVGLAGCSIEDAAAGKLYEFNLAVERVAAAARNRKLVLTARAENFLRGNPDLDDTIRRLKAYEKAGADVLMAPGLPDLEAVRKVCAALSKPFNFMAGIKGKSFSVAELEAAGVRRVSVATSFYRAAMSSLLTAAQEVKDKGSFGYLERTMATPDLNAFMGG